MSKNAREKGLTFYRAITLAEKPIDVPTPPPPPQQPCGAASKASPIDALRGASRLHQQMQLHPAKRRDPEVYKYSESEEVVFLLSLDFFSKATVASRVERVVCLMQHKSAAARCRKAIVLFPLETYERRVRGDCKSTAWFFLLRRALCHGEIACVGVLCAVFLRRGCI